MRAGSMLRRLTVLRREIDAENPGVARGDFVEVWRTRCSLRQQTAREQVEAGVGIDPLLATIRVRDCRAARQITHADRVVVDDAPFAVQSVSLPEQRGAYVEILLRRALEA